NSFTAHARAGESTISPAGRKTKSATDEDGGCALSNETRDSFCAGERRDADHALAESGAAKSARLSTERRCLHDFGPRPAGVAAQANRNAAGQRPGIDFAGWFPSGVAGKTPRLISDR